LDFENSPLLKNQIYNNNFCYNIEYRNNRYIIILDVTIKIDLVKQLKEPRHKRPAEDVFKEATTFETE
jgi:hypothetical protein